MTRRYALNPVTLSWRQHSPLEAAADRIAELEDTLFDDAVVGSSRTAESRS